MTIREIILHPRYREFAAWATRRGMHVLPNSYPWRLMGISAAESETGHESRGTSDEDGTEAEPVEFEEDQPRD